MSAFAGIFDLRGGSIDPLSLNALGEPLARRAPNPPAIVTDGSIGMIFRPYGDVPLDAPALPTLWRSRAGDVLAFDGRVDNLPDLARRFGFTGERARSRSAVLLEGFAQAGPSFAGAIVGDFAFAYWNHALRRLTLGRDCLGARTLYWHHTPQSFAFATDLAALARTRDLGSQLDDDYIAGFLIGAPPLARTIYRSVACVRPATILTVSESGDIREEVGWSLPTEPAEIVYRTDREYEAHFRHLFEESVRARLNTSATVIGELSGGMDSSSIVCMADHLMRTAPTEVTTSLTTATRVLDRSTTADEARFRVSVERQCERPHVHVLESQIPNVHLLPEVDDLFVPTYVAVCSGYEQAISQEVRALDAHLLLSGIGGDELCISTSLPLPGLGDLWRRRHFRTLHAEVEAWSRALKVPYYKMLWQTITERDPSLRQQSIPGWIHPRLHERIRAIRRERSQTLAAYRWPSQRDHAFSFISVVNIIASGARQDFAPRAISFPFLHRPFVEFMQAIPYTQKLRRGENRSLQRRALQDILPEVLVRRRGKTRPHESYLREVREHAGELQRLLTRSTAAASAFIDEGEARAAFERMAVGVSPKEWAPYAACSLELWLRSHGGGERVRTAA